MSEYVELAEEFESKSKSFPDVLPSSKRVRDFSMLLPRQIL